MGETVFSNTIFLKQFIFMVSTHQLIGPLDNSVYKLLCPYVCMFAWCVSLGTLFPIDWRLLVQWQIAYSGWFSC